jgi:DNA-binding NtrC family response regulator
MAGEKILVVDDEPQFLQTIREFLLSENYKVLPASSCAQAEQTWKLSRPDVAILDFQLPDGTAHDLLPRLRSCDRAIPVIILTGHGSIDLAVESIKLGAEHFLTKPPDLATLHLLIERSLENERNRQRQVASRARLLREQINPFLGTSAAIRQLAALAERVAASESAVLILGETGTGKGVLAHWLHENSRRSSEPFVDLNCGGLSRELLETELFGHEKGAFTGAVTAKTGLMEIAHRGTIFLDEIGDMDIQVQPKLLKVLEEKQFRRLGETRDRKVDVRLVAATHHEMTRLMKEGRFRSDLYFRISTIPLITPALRDRREDIPILAQYLLNRLVADLGAEPMEITPDAMRSLQSYPWPGNIRELRNVLERAILLSGRRVLSERDLHFDAREEHKPSERNLTRTLEQVEREYIEEVLAAEGGRVEVTARKLGIPRSSLYSKIKQYGLGRAATAGSST